jgi:hypothetical protein
MMTEYRKDILVGVLFVTGTLGIISGGIYYLGNAVYSNRLFQYYLPHPSNRRIITANKLVPPRDIVYIYNA